MALVIRDRKPFARVPSVPDALHVFLDGTSMSTQTASILEYVYMVLVHKRPSYYDRRICELYNLLPVLSCRDCCVAGGCPAGSSVFRMPRVSPAPVRLVSDLGRYCMTRSGATYAVLPVAGTVLSVSLLPALCVARPCVSPGPTRCCMARLGAM